MLMSCLCLFKDMRRKIIVNVQSRIVYSESHVCPLEVSVIDVRKQLGYTFYVKDKCNSCEYADQEDSEYLFYLRNFKLLSDNAVKKAVTNKTIQKEIILNKDSTKLDWTWYMNYGYNDVDIFFLKLIEDDNICFIYSTNVSMIFLKQYDRDIFRFLDCKYISNYILSVNVFNLCVPSFHRYKNKTQKHRDNYITKRKYFLHCSGYIVYAICQFEK